MPHPSTPLHVQLYPEPSPHTPDTWRGKRAWSLPRPPHPTPQRQGRRQSCTYRVQSVYEVIYS